MARTCWISFCIAGHGPYADRYYARTAALESAVAFVTSSSLWREAPGTIIFDTECDLEEIMAEVAKAIDVEVDLILLYDIASGKARILGPHKDKDIFLLLPLLASR